MKNQITHSVGWKKSQFLYGQPKLNKEQALGKGSLYLSILFVVIIVVIVAQILSVATASAATSSATLMLVSQKDITAEVGSTVTLRVGFKNLSDKTWLAGGTNQTKLAFKIKPPYERTSIFYNKSWRKTSSPAYLNSGDTQPGQIGYFEFKLTVPKKTGTYSEKFNLAVNAVPIAGSEMEIKIQAVNKAQVAKKVTPVVTPAPTPAKPADPAPVQKTVELVIAENTDVCTKTTNHIRYTATFLQQVRPFCETLYAEDKIVIPDPNKPVITNPTNNIIPVTVPEPIIRVGIYKPEGAVLITANAAYRIEDSAGNLLLSVPANIETQASFDYSTHRYSYLANGKSAVTSSYLRFKSETSGAVFTITNYEDRAAWNKTINYNQFLGILEIRYAEANDKFWVINELPIETYLKGLAETSNNAPMDYMKALISTARTYTMYHYNRGTKHADRHFTVDAYYDQVYKGYAAQKVLPRLSEAVEATRGRVVTYAGAVVVTPYFSHSDGRTRSWGEVWGNGDKYPWCVSVKEPAGFDKDYMYGHGVGLSARGAIILDNDLHYTWEQILKYYFTGIDVAGNYGIK